MGCSIWSRRSPRHIRRQLKAGYAAGEQKRWKTFLPRVLVRLAHYKAIDGKFRLFRYGHWIPAQWREVHELYEFARMRGCSASRLRRGCRVQPARRVARTAIHSSLLLMRLDSGNFTPDQVEWVARSLEEWTPSLTLTPPPGIGANFYVDLSGTQGLKRQDQERTGGRLMYLDATAVYARVVDACAHCGTGHRPHLPGALPPREQKVAPDATRRVCTGRMRSRFRPARRANRPTSEMRVSSACRR